MNNNDNNNGNNMNNFNSQMGNNQPTNVNSNVGMNQNVGVNSNDLNQNVNTIQNPGVQPNVMSQNMGMNSNGGMQPNMMNQNPNMMNQNPNMMNQNPNMMNQNMNMGMNSNSNNMNNNSGVQPNMNSNGNSPKKNNSSKYVIIAVVVIIAIFLVGFFLKVTYNLVEKVIETAGEENGEVVEKDKIGKSSSYTIGKYKISVPSKFKYSSESTSSSLVFDGNYRIAISEPLPYKLDDLGGYNELKSEFSSIGTILLENTVIKDGLTIYTFKIALNANIVLYYSAVEYNDLTIIMVSNATDSQLDDFCNTVASVAKNTKLNNSGDFSKNDSDTSKPSKIIDGSSAAAFN